MIRVLPKRAQEAPTAAANEIGDRFKRGDCR